VDRKRNVVLVAVAVAATLGIAALAGCQRGPSASEQLATSLAAADEVFNGRQYEEAGTLFETISADAEAAGVTSAYVEACAMRARSLLATGNKEDGRAWLEKAAASVDETDPAGWSRYLGVRGRFEWQDDDNETATLTFVEMFDYCDEHDLYERGVDAAHMVAITGTPEEKTEWAVKGIEMAEAGGLTEWLGPLWNNLGWDHMDAERYDEALEALRNAREYHNAGDDEYAKMIADYSVAYAMRRTGDGAGAKSRMDNVFRWANRLYANGNEDAVEWMGYSRWELGEIAIENGEGEVALRLFKKGLSELEQAGIAEWDTADWEAKKARIEELTD